MPWSLKSVLPRLRSVVLLLAVAVCLSCGGDDDDGGPAAPQEFLITFAGGITNLDCACLHDFEVLFDGRVLSGFQSVNAIRATGWTVSTRAPRGQHQVSVRLTRQTSTASEYLILGALDGFNSTGGTVLDLELQDRLATLRPGESVSWSFTF